MTYDAKHFSQTSTGIQNANGVLSPVTGADTTILTGEIIGRGTERGGLYYIDDYSMVRALIYTNKELRGM